MRNPLSDRIVEIKPSGIRKFFDIVSEMDDAISLGVGSPILIPRDISGMRVFILWKRDVPFTPPIPVLRNYVRKLLHIFRGHRGLPMIR